MSMQGIQNAARSLSYYLRLQEVTANNLANAGTDAFKADRITGWQAPGGGHAVPVQNTDLQQGPFRETARPLDLALDGTGFMVVRTPAGERLFRGGSLQLDPQGRLADSHGNPVLGEDGHPIVIQGASVEVHGDGSVQVDGAGAGRLRLLAAEDPSLLRKEGFGRFLTEGRLGPVAEGSVRVRQGAVEEANFNPLVQMVDLVTIQRAYAASVDSLRVMDGVLGIVTSQVGKV